MNWPDTLWSSTTDNGHHRSGWRFRCFAIAMTLMGLTRALQAQEGPSYADEAGRAVVEAMVEAHGGLERWRQIPSVSFWFFTKTSVNPEGFLSHETIEPSTERAHLDWPVFGATVAYDGSTVWSEEWPLGLSPGFFTRLTYSFIALPFLTQQAGATIGEAGTGTIPNDDTEYATVRMELEKPTGTMPGTYYRLYIDPESHVLKAIEFDISHPGLVANQTQPLGPNFHVFEQYRQIGGITLPTYYVSYGFNQRNSKSSNAIHYVFGVSLDRAFDESKVQKGPSAVADDVTNTFWQRGR